MTFASSKRNGQRLFHAFFVAGGWLIFVGAFVWPTIALLGRGALELLEADSTILPTSRQWQLLGRSAWMAIVAAGGATLIAFPVTVAFWRLTGRLAKILACSLAATCLMCPPTVLAFGWDRWLGPIRVDASIRCMAFWALWCWPLAALILVSSKQAWERAGLEAARLEATRFRAFIHVGLPALRRPIGLALIVLFMLFFTDYGVPHACGLSVYATELLGWASSATHIAETLQPSLPSVAVVMFGIVVIYRSLSAQQEPPGVEPSATPTPLPKQSPLSNRLAGKVFSSSIFIALFAASFFLPVATLANRPDLGNSLAEAWKNYGNDLLWTLATAAIAAVCALWMGLVTTRRRFPGTVIAFWALAFGAVPGALVGVSLVAAYNRAVFSPFFDHWPIMVAAHTARFAWVAIVSALISARSVPPELMDQSRTDGASDFQGWLHLRIPLVLPTLLTSAIIIIVLSLGDIATTSLVRVPDFNPIALVLIEKFHRFEDGMLTALSLWLVGAGVLAGAVASWAVLRFQHR